MKNGIIILTVSLALFCSCEPKDKQTNDISSASIKPIEKVTMPQEKKNVQNNTNTTKSENKDFTEIRKVALSSNLKTTMTTGENKYPIKTIGEYDLNMDSKLDNIEIIFNTSVPNENPNASVITINGVKSEVYTDSPMTIWLVDLDKKDKYTEIALLDDGPSGDPNVSFFRYTGTDIVNLGSIHENVLINGDGDALSTWTMANFEPKIILREYHLEGNKIESKLTDFAPMLNKDYAISSDMQVEGYFKEMDSAPENFSSSFYEVPTVKFTPGETFTLRKIGLSDDGIPMWYYVEFKNGKKGVLSFWMGD